MKTESDDSEMKQIVKDECPSGDEDNSGGSSSGGGQVLKKGPWTSAEDVILVEYVDRHGEGNWNAVQKYSGLSRCGKSCRLRWANHLRPNLKKGSFSLEEENLIIKLHSQIGNKWARMAAQLPGRTDNEIKNFWNTRIKRLQRAGAPVYPAEICQGSDENHLSPGIPDFGCGNRQTNEIFHRNLFEVPVPFDNFDAYNDALSFPVLPVPQMSISGMLNQEYLSQNLSSLSPVMNSVKQLGEPDTLAPSFCGPLPSGLSFLEQLPVEPLRKMQRTSNLDYRYDPKPDSMPSFVGAVNCNPAIINGNLSASGSFSDPVKSELPSLQYIETYDSGWLACPSSPPVDMIESFTEPPLETISLHPECVSPQNSGLLDSLLHEARAKKHSFEKSLSSSIMTSNKIVRTSDVNINGTEWKHDPISPLRCSTATIFNECTPICGNSLTESSLMKVFYGSDDILLSNELTTSKIQKTEFPSYSDGIRPDALLEFWAEDDESQGTIAALLGPDFSGDYNHVSVGTSTSSQGIGLESYPWHNMPHACQMSELS